MTKTWNVTWLSFSHGLCAHSRCHGQLEEFSCGGLPLRLLFPLAQVSSGTCFRK